MLRARAATQRVVNDGRGIRARRLSDNRHVRTFTPFLELLDRGRAKRVGRREQHRVACAVEPMCELADRRRLAGAVHTEHEDHEGFSGAVDVERRLDGLHEIERCLRERSGGGR